MFANGEYTEDMAEIKEFLQRERSKALSDAEWRFRMRGYGYHLRQIEGGVQVARLPQNRILGTVAL